MNVKEILTKSQKNTEGLLKSGKGLSKEKIYKKEIFEGLNEKEKKQYRIKLRKHLQQLIDSLLFHEKNQDLKKVQSISKDFQEFYKNAYQLNDYSISSLCSEQKHNKELIEKGLTIIKATLKIK